MDGWLIYAILIVGAAVLLALGRGWWFGLPASVMIAVMLLVFGNDYPALFGMLLAVVSGAMLPSKDRLPAIAIGIILSAVFLVIAAAPDSPVNFIVAACAGSFAIGALTGWAVAAARKVRRHDQIEA